MATLVQFLAAGVNGAASGSATFVLRGTASSAQSVMYNEFEALTQPATNVVTLDANGAAEVYVDAYVDVEIKNSAGTTLRTVTVGNSAPLVEVQSTSFTGTDYDGNPANTVGEPITLKAILDKWITSAGASNWQVLVDGVATDLDEAVAGFTGMFTNVKSPDFGATGDGVTDDTTAILAATTAAAGGIVFFPPGTYKVDTLSLSGANINWLGSGDGATIISGITDTTLIALTDNTNTGWKNFQGIGFTSSGAYTRLFALEETQNASFSDCSFDASQCSSNAIETNSTTGLSRIVIRNCNFTLGASTASCIRNLAATSARNIVVSGCTFTVPSGFTGSILRGADFSVSGCRFDASAVTSGVYHSIDAEDATVAGKYVGTFTGNKFLDGGSDGFAFELTSLTAACAFSESDNAFIGFAVPALEADAGHIYDCSVAAGYDQTSRVHLGSRIGKMLLYTNASESNLNPIYSHLVADTIVIVHTNASNLVVSHSSTDMPVGLGWSTVAVNESGSSRDITLGASNVTGDAATVADDGRVMASFFSYSIAAGTTIATGRTGRLPA